MNIGAIYRKCDFQAHTPRDDNFSGSEYITDEERKSYAKRFIAACRTKGVDAVAITDHHDLVFYNYIKQASNEETDKDGGLVPEHKRIIVFPGMELTLDVPCQALLIFDSNLEIDDELRTRIYTALGINNYTPKSSSKAVSPVERISFKSINAVFESLNGLKAVQNRFTIFPNIKENGGDSILREGFHNEYANGIFVGGYLDKGQYEKHKSRIGWNNVISGKTEAYGFKSIGLFQTSDCRSENFETLGTSSTWVKWSEPTAEGLRQACLAKTSRISQEEPELPNTQITSLKVLNSSFLKDISIDFNPQFNVLIGGRGAGKSSILQYISWALGKDSDERKRSELDSFVNSTLSNQGEVHLKIVKNGVVYQIIRKLSSIQVKIGDQDWTSTTNKNLVDILQADSFSQKELSKHEKNRTDQLTQLIEYSINDELNSSRRQIRENEDSIKEASTIYETLINNRKALFEISNQIESTKEQIRKLSEELSDVPEEDKKILRDHNLVQNEKQIIQSRNSVIENAKKSINQLLNSIDLDEIQLDIDTVLNKEELREFSKLHNELLISVGQKLREALSSSNPDLNKSIDKIASLHSEHDAKYEAAKVRQIRFEGIIKALEQLRNQLKVLNEDKQRIEASIEKNKTVSKDIRELYHWRNQKNFHNWQMVKSAKLIVAGKSDGSLQIELSYLSKIDHIVKKFIEDVTGSKGQPERTSSFFNELCNGNLTYKNLLKFWLCLFQAKQNEEADLNVLLNNYGLSNNHFVEGDIKRIIQSLSFNQIVEFSLMLPTYELELKYRKDSENIIPFEDASYGQQAGAILSILLNQETGPLIIDQPEDDLDNKVIHQITESIVNAKKKRQLIFSSHNANVAVNGDAELILCFDHNSDRSSGEVHSKGAIDNLEVKAMVKDIMEGGEKAFNMRQTKYGF